MAGCRYWVWAEQPIFAAIDRIACQREPCRPSLSKTSRTAHSRTSGENVFVVLLMMLRPTQEPEPRPNPTRFTIPRETHLDQPMKRAIIPNRWLSQAFSTAPHHQPLHLDQRHHILLMVSGHRQNGHKYKLRRDHEKSSFT